MHAKREFTLLQDFQQVRSAYLLNGQRYRLFAGCMQYGIGLPFTSMLGAPLQVQQSQNGRQRRSTDAGNACLARRQPASAFV